MITKTFTPTDLKSISDAAATVNWKEVAEQWRLLHKEKAKFEKALAGREYQHVWIDESSDIPPIPIKPASIEPPKTDKPATEVADVW